MVPTFGLDIMSPVTRLVGLSVTETPPGEDGVRTSVRSVSYEKGLLSRHRVLFRVFVDSPYHLWVLLLVPPTLI